MAISFSNSATGGGRKPFVKRPPPTFLTAWSYSRLKLWEGCARKAKYKFLDKLPEPDSEATARGTLYHTVAQGYMTAAKTPPKFPHELAMLEAEFTAARAYKVTAEGEWAFTEQWAPTGWFDSNAWCRIKIDAQWHTTPQHLSVVDHKTGKIRPEEHEEQLELYSVGAFAKYPELKIVTAQMWYLDEGSIGSETYKRPQAAKLQKKWAKRAAPMLADRVFAPNPGNACRWCPYSKSKSGPCEF